MPFNILKRTPKSPAKDDGLNDRIKFVFSGYINLSQAEREVFRKLIDKFDWKLTSEKHAVSRQVEKWVGSQHLSTKREPCPSCGT